MPSTSSTDDPKPPDEWQLRWVHIPKGTQLSNSKATPGANRDLLRDKGTNKLLGPTESRPADQDKLAGTRDPDLVDQHATTADVRTEGQETFAGAIVAAALEGIINGLTDALSDPEVRGGLATLAGNAGRSIKAFVGDSVFGRRRRKEKPAESESRELATESTLDPDAEPDISDQLEQEHEMLLAASSVALDADEFRARLLAALAAEEFAAEQKRVLAAVHVEDDELPLELQHALALALQVHSSALDRATLALVMKFLGRSGGDDAEYALVNQKAIQEVPSAARPMY